MDRKALDHVANLLRVAKKPILYVGQGANDAVAELTAFAELCNIPVTTTLHAMGVFSEHHRLSMHMLGMHGAAYANYAIQASDLILAVGSRFDDRTTGLLGKYAPVAKAAAEEGKVTLTLTLTHTLTPTLTVTLTPTLTVTLTP